MSRILLCAKAVVVTAEVVPFKPAQNKQYFLHCLHNHTTLRSVVGGTSKLSPLVL